ncbi:hypothetical protein KFK09_018821 [Dendrobium nobile]|uniref:Uncharacterized protein n=1 Tax=Dendrobium nobile TaxID=94219 RepID=A0A8T3AWV2_DENNO|nr:hypothetical protein KFK09_018821 [Dendrobium nobile]
MKIHFEEDSSVSRVAAELSDQKNSLLHSKKSSDQLLLLICKANSTVNEKGGNGYDIIRGSERHQNFQEILMVPAFKCVCHTVQLTLFLFLVQWTDCSLAGALGLLRILIYKVYIDGTTTMSTHERKASIKEFYGITDMRIKNKKQYVRKGIEEEMMRTEGSSRRFDAEREEECGSAWRLRSSLKQKWCCDTIIIKWAMHVAPSIGQVPVVTESDPLLFRNSRSQGGRPSRLLAAWVNDKAACKWKDKRIIFGKFQLGKGFVGVTIAQAAELSTPSTDLSDRFSWEKRSGHKGFVTSSWSGMNKLSVVVREGGIDGLGIVLKIAQ